MAHLRRQPGRGLGDVVLRGRPLPGHGGIDNGIYFWDLKAKSALRAVSHDHEGWIAALAWSADERVIASASWDNTLGLFRANDLNPLFGFEQHSDYVVQVMFVPNSPYLVSASYDRTIAVWDWRNAELITVFDEHEDWIQALRWVGAGLFASASSDRSVRLWSIETLSCVAVLDEGSSEDWMSASLGSTSSLSSWNASYETGYPDRKTRGLPKVRPTDQGAQREQVLDALATTSEVGLDEVSAFFDERFLPTPSRVNPTLPDEDAPEQARHQDASEEPEHLSEVSEERSEDLSEERSDDPVGEVSEPEEEPEDEVSLEAADAPDDMELDEVSEHEPSPSEIEDLEDLEDLEDVEELEDVEDSEITDDDFLEAFEHFDLGDVADMDEELDDAEADETPSEKTSEEEPSPPPRLRGRAGTLQALKTLVQREASEVSEAREASVADLAQASGVLDEQEEDEGLFSVTEALFGTKTSSKLEDLQLPQRADHEFSRNSPTPVSTPALSMHRTAESSSADGESVESVQTAPRDVSEPLNADSAATVRADAVVEQEGPLERTAMLGFAKRALGFDKRTTTGARRIDSLIEQSLSRIDDADEHTPPPASVLGDGPSAISDPMEDNPNWPPTSEVLLDVSFAADHTLDLPPSPSKTSPSSRTSPPRSSAQTNSMRKTASSRSSPHRPTSPRCSMSCGRRRTCRASPTIAASRRRRRIARGPMSRSSPRSCRR